jgi:hypothetical protein
LLAVNESLFTLRPNDRRFPPLTGETVFALKAWDPEVLSTALSRSDATASHPDGQSPGFTVLSLAEGFQPGVYTRLQLDLHLPAQHFDAPRSHLESYLRDAYLPYSLRREPSSQEGRSRYRFEIPMKGLRKKILWSGCFDLDSSGMEAHLEIGPGFDLREFLETFDRDYPRHCCAWAHIDSVQW